MHFFRLAQWLRIPAIALISVVLASCGSGDGEDPVTVSSDDTLVTGFRLIFEDDFGGPAGAAPRTAGKAPLTVDKWRVVTGRGPNNDGFGNNEWQTYQNSIDNLFIENGALVLEARCDTAPNCNNGDGSVTSARITTKDKFEIKYGGIQARIKVPGQRGMWPAFWMLGSDWPESDWPDVGEIDIMEMLYGISDPQTVHFTTHWAGPNDAPTAAGCSGVPGAADPANETENCLSKTKEFDEPLSNDYHVFEVVWNERAIIGKVDGITYFIQAIDPNTMEEFQSKMYLLLNLAVGGAAGGDPSNVDWTDPAKIEDRQMKVDWVRVYQAVLPDTATLIAETGRNIDYNRIIQSQEFQGNEVTANLNSTAVPALEGSQVLQVDYTNTKSGNPGGPDAGFGGIFFEFNSADATSFTNLVFSINTSGFPSSGPNKYHDMTIELKDTSDTALQVLLSDPRVTRTEGPGKWETYNVPLSAFAGVDISKILFLGFLNPVNSADQLINGTLYIDGIRLVNKACAPNATVAFDAVNYRPDASVAQITVNDSCAANSVATVKVETGTEEIVVGVDLDAAGHGETLFSFVSPVSICPASDEDSTIALSDPLIATYNHTYRGPSGAERIDTATATAGIDPMAIETEFTGEQSYIIAADSNQPLAFALDTDFNLSDFGSGSDFSGFPFLDDTFGPVWPIANSANSAAVFAMFNFSTGFTSGQASINFKVKDMPGNVVLVQFGDLDQAFPVDLTDTSLSTPLVDGWYEVRIPMTNFPTPDAYNYLVIKSNASSPVDFRFLVTDIFLEAPVGSVGAECAAPTTAAPTPTEDPMDVISLLNSGNVYSNVVVDTWFQFGNAALLETTLDGSDIKRYSNLGFVGIQTESTSIDASQMTNLRLDVWSAGVTELEVKLVDFLADMTPGTISEDSVFLPLAQGEWVSLDISLSDFNDLTNDTDIQQLIFAATGGSGTIFIGNVYYYNDGSGVDLITNGGFETADFTGWTPAIGGGPGMSSITVVDTQDSGSTWSANIVAGQQNNPALSQTNLAMGTVMPGDTIDISFDWCGSAADGGEVAFALLSEFGVNAGSDRDEFNRTASPPNVWTRYSTSRTAGANVDGGISLQFDVVCGGAANCSANVYFDNVTVTRGGGPAPGNASGQSCVGGGPGPGGGAPATAAPPPLYADVISLFSDAYADVPVDTWRTVWSSATLDESVVVQGSALKLYESLDFVGIEFANPTIDASGMTHIHVDVWTPDATSGGEVFRVKLVDFGTGTEHEIAFDSTTTPALATGTWVGLDIPLTDFTNGNLAGTAALGQLIFSGTLGGGPGQGTVYIDNVYFYNSAGGIGPAIAAPTPTQADVISLFSDAYADVPVDTWRTVWSSATLDESVVVQGSALKLYESLDFVGIEFANPTIDASGMTHIHVDVWTPDATSGGEVFRVKLVDFGTGTEHEIAFDSTTTPALATGTWVGLDIPLTDFTNGNLAGTAALGQLIFSGTLGGGPGQGTVYIDNVYFYNSPGGSGGGEIAINGGFEDGNFNGWTLFPSAPGNQTVNPSMAGDTSSEGSFHAQINNTTPGTNSLFKQERVGLGTVTPGIAWTVTFDARGDLDSPNGAVAFAEFFCETTNANETCGSGVAANGILGDAPLAINADPQVWTSFSFSGTAGPNTESLTLQLGAITGGGTFANMFFDNISILVGTP